MKDKLDDLNAAVNRWGRLCIKEASLAAARETGCVALMSAALDPDANDATVAAAARDYARLKLQWWRQQMKIRTAQADNTASWDALAMEHML